MLCADRFLLCLLLLLAPGCSEGEECREGLVCVVAGTGWFGFNGDGLPALETDLYLPTSVREDRDGGMLFVDFNNLRVRRLAADGTVETLAGNGVHGYSAAGELAIDSPLENPIDALVGPDGKLYIVPLHEGRVLRLDDESRVEVVAGTGELGESGDGGPALEARLWYPAGIAFGPDGALYISDLVLGNVRRVLDGIIEEVMDGLDSPRGLWATEERLLVADSRNHRVQALQFATGEVSTLVGDGTRDVLHFPDAVAVTPGGNVLISEQRGRVISLLRPDGSLQAVVGTGEASEPTARALPPERMPLLGPGGLDVVGDDVWIADTEGSLILVWTGGVSAVDGG